MTTISADWITAVAAIAALVVAMIIAWRQIQIQNEQTEIAKKQAEIASQQLNILNYQEQERRIENSSAKLRAEFIERFSPKNIIFRYALRIKNEGKTTAREIQIIIDDRPAHEYFAFLHGLNEEDLPRKLEQNELWEHDMAFAAGQEPKFNIKIKWSDDSGLPRLFEQRLLPRKEIPIQDLN